VETYVETVPRRLPPSAYLGLEQSGGPRRSAINVFGTHLAKRWSVPRGGTKEGLRAAQLQHQVVRAYRERMLSRGEESLAALAAGQSYFTYARLRSLFAGDAWMRIEDLAELNELLGAEVRIR